jgi:signal recognition particle GTPase
MLVAADVYRPAAIDQLTILGKKVRLINLSISS